MGLMKRMKDMLSASVNSALDDMEDSEKMLDEYVREMNDELAKAKDSVASVIATRNTTKNQYEEMDAKIKDMDKKARLAVSKGQDELAKKALANKNVLTAQYDNLGTQVETLNKQVDKLKENISQLEMNINQAKARKDSLKAKLNTAKTQEKINSVMNGIGENSSGRDFDRIAKKIDEKYEKEMAKAELSESSLDRQLNALEMDSATGNVDAELEALKAEMNSNK